MKWTKHKYHYAVRRAKRQTNCIRARELKEAADKGDGAFMEELKKTLGKKKDEQVVPDSLEGEVTKEGIQNKFREMYKDLYNSAGTREEMVGVKQNMAEMIGLAPAVECEKITPEVMKRACARMKHGKKDVTGSYSSDLFLHAPDLMFAMLAEVFKSYLVHGTVSKQILVCAFLPLYKGGQKNPELFKSYRAIAGASQLLKQFEYVILEVWGDTMVSDSLQFGYRQGMSTTQCTWLVNEVSGHYIKQGGSVCAALMDCSMAFDKCLFSKLFTKMLDKGVPALVVRALAFVYEEQSGCVRLDGEDSESFTLTNGTRQGSVLSPALWCIYLDGLLIELRKKKLGCHVAGLWMGACAYADDLLCLAPTRLVLQKMMEVCEEYGREHNLVFSTDPVPSKSKTKGIFFCGEKNRSKVRYPDEVTLNGENLPWEVTGVHLGHILHQDGTMDQDSKVRRARFIDHSVEVRQKLCFAGPDMVLKAHDIYCCDAYGAMLWNLRGRAAESFFKAWNTAVKLTHRVPRSTHTYLVEGLLATEHTTLRNQVLGRYPGFLQGLMKSPSPEVQFLVRVMMNTPRSNTRDNINYIQELTGLSARYHAKSQIRAALPVMEVPELEKWRLGLLHVLFDQRKIQYENQQTTEFTNSLIGSLCST